MAGKIEGASLGGVGAVTYWAGASKTNAFTMDDKPGLFSTKSELLDTMLYTCPNSKFQYSSQPASTIIEKSWRKMSMLMQ